MSSILVWSVLCSLPLALHACTLIAATVGASLDGSSLVGSTNDCQDCDFRIAKIAARTWPEGSLRPVYFSNDDYPREVKTNRSSLYNPVAGQQASIPLGFIPQVPHTYAYWEALYGFMNEHGLGVAESSCPSKFMNLKDMGALLSIRELTRLAMERCKTARCAVTTVGSLAEQHGFYGEDPDLSGAGDSLAFADGTETWIFHISGEPTKRSAFWVAQRLPDGHVAIVANTFIIRTVHCTNNSDFYCSIDLEKKVYATGEWNGKGHLDWAAVIAPDLRTTSYVLNGYKAGPIPYYVTARTWRVFSKLAPSLGLELTDDILGYPFSVRPAELMSHRSFIDLWRDNYEGTEIDLTVGALAGPFGSPYRMDAGIGLHITKGQFARSFSLPRTNALFVSHTFGESGINKLWIGQDTPASTVLVPFYAKSMLCDDSYSIGNMSVYDDRSAWWVFDFVANWMSINYRLMSVDVKAKIHALQDDIDRKNHDFETAAQVRIDDGDVHGAAELLEQHQTSLQRHIVDTWRRFSHFLIMKYNDGYVNDVTVGMPIGYPAWWLQMFHVDSHPTPKWAQPSARAPGYFEQLGPGPYETLPARFEPNDIQLHAVSTPGIAVNQMELWHISQIWFWHHMSVVASLTLGFLLGRVSVFTRAVVVHNSDFLNDPLLNQVL